VETVHDAVVKSDGTTSNPQDDLSYPQLRNVPRMLLTGAILLSASWTVATFVCQVYLHPIQYTWLEADHGHDARHMHAVMHGLMHAGMPTC